MQHYAKVEHNLRPLADPLAAPRPGDWLAEHHETGQTFAEYLDAQPIRRSDQLHNIYLCFVGEFNEAQRGVLDLAQHYLALFFDCPVTVNRQVPLASVPAQAKRIHPSWGDPQVLTSYILHEVLERERPADALAYLALTASDLWPGKGRQTWLGSLRCSWLRSSSISFSLDVAGVEEAFLMPL